MTDGRPGPGPGIGPLGVAARLVVGLSLIGLALFWRDPSWQDAALGLVFFPAIVSALVVIRAKHSPAPLRAVGPGGHLLNALVFVPLFLVPATAGAAFFFYGSSMLIAATRRLGGCEVTAISNTVLAREDQVGCALFAPVDMLEGRLHRSSAGSESARS